MGGEPVSEEMMNGLRSQNLAEFFLEDPEMNEYSTLLANLESIEVADGSLTIAAKPAGTVPDEPLMPSPEGEAPIEEPANL